MKNLKAENEKLKLQLAEAQQIISEQQETINQLQNNFDLGLYNAIDLITRDYSAILNPLPIEVKASIKNKPETFRVEASNVICIIADGRIKNIYLKSRAESIEGELRTTNIIIVNDNEMSLEKLRHKIDSIGYHLIKVSKSCVVNMTYYALNKDVVELNLEEHRSKDFARVGISAAFKEDFRQRKAMLESIISLHKKFFGYIQ